MKDGSMIPHLLNPPNWFTSASIFCGFLALTFAAGVGPGETTGLYQAAIAIVFAGIFDMMDGRVARMTGKTSEFGIQYDSLADVMSFGLAPAFLLYQWGLSSLGVVGLAVAFVYVTCGAMRLARFNILTHTLPPAYSLGLTITESGGTIAALVILDHRLGLGMAHHPLLAVLGVCLAYLMASTLRFRTFKEMRMTQTTRVMLSLLFLTSLVVLFLYRDFSVLMVFLPTAHILSGLVEELVFTRTRRQEEAPAGAESREALEALAPDSAPAGNHGSRSVDDDGFNAT